VQIEVRWRCATVILKMFGAKHSTQWFWVNAVSSILQEVIRIVLSTHRRGEDGEASRHSMPRAGLGAARHINSQSHRVQSREGNGGCTAHRASGWDSLV
jgi:hypothetical protein